MQIQMCRWLFHLQRRFSGCGSSLAAAVPEGHRRRLTPGTRTHLQGQELWSRAKSSAFHQVFRWVWYRLSFDNRGSRAWSPHVSGWCQDISGPALACLSSLASPLHAEHQHSVHLIWANHQAVSPLFVTGCRQDHLPISDSYNPMGMRGAQPLWLHSVLLLRDVIS